jgi:hypothetical protein
MINEKKQILQTLQEREELADYLKQKSQSYENWRLFVLSEVEILKKRLEADY